MRMGCVPFLTAAYAFLASFPRLLRSSTVCFPWSTVSRTEETVSDTCCTLSDTSFTLLIILPALETSCCPAALLSADAAVEASPLDATALAADETAAAAPPLASAELAVETAPATALKKRNEAKQNGGRRKTNLLRRPLMQLQLPWL